MELITGILTALSTAARAVSGSLAVGQWLVNYIRTCTREKRAADVLTFLHDLGCVNEAEVQTLVKNWKPPTPVSDEVRGELTALLTNLVRGARFHTTQGTPLSSYLRCERLIAQLLAKLEPKRRAGQSVGPGRADWKLERFLGMGAFGEVWEGRNKRFPRPRAFKFFTTEGSKDWLAREAEALYRVKDKLDDHPNVIEYHDIEIDAQPYPFLMLEYVGGGSLEDWILTPAADRKPLDVAELMAGIARGLAEAHRHRIYHRDLKPANVLLTEGADPVPKIADFGLSRVEADASAGSSSVVSQAAVVGTRMYLPPEAADPYEERSEAQDDVFAFGVVWYQVLSGKIERPPYDFADRLHQVGVDSRSMRLLSRCLAHPARRFRDAVELLAALDADAPPAQWKVPQGCVDVGPLAREYLDSLAR
jgi:eukaryotic-like serine/threonine-protein kinase